MALADNIVAYWKCDESSGNAADSVGSNTLTNTNTATFGTGKINNGMILNGSNQYFTTGTTSLMQDYSGLTMAAWVNTDVLNNYRRFISKTNSSNYNQFLRMTNGNKFELAVTAAAERGVTGSTTISTGVWYYVAGTYDGSVGRLYVNGSLEGTTSSTSGNTRNESNAVEIGREGSGGEYWDGKVDEIGIWSRALSGSEILELYNGGNGLQYPFTTFNPAMMHHMQISGGLM